jgi:hypothetical protein
LGNKKGSLRRSRLIDSYDLIRFFLVLISFYAFDFISFLSFREAV